MRRGAAWLVLAVCAWPQGAALGQGDAGLRDASPHGVTEDAPDASGIGDIDVRALMAAEPEIEVSAAASTAQVMLGKPFSVFVTVVHPPGVQVNVPASLPLGDAFESGRRNREEHTRADGKRVAEVELELVAWDVGDLMIPPIPVTYAVAGTVRAVASDPVPIQVIGLVGDSQESLRDIARPVSVYRRDHSLLYHAGAVLFGVLAVALTGWGVRASRRRARVPHTAITPAREPAHREALARLVALEASGALAAGDRKPAFLAMSEIMRVYLGRRYGLPGLDATTSELRQALAARPDAMDTELGKMLVPWLEACDLAKYAGAEASEEEARQALDTARRMVAVSQPGAGESTLG